MTKRERLRPAWSDAEMAAMYAEPHDHRLWGRGHGERVEQMIELAKLANAQSVADLSCGNAAVAKSLDLPEESTYLGDYAPGYQFTGPIEQTLNEIGEVDLFVCGETLEHLDDPDGVLSLIHQKAKSLVLSSPIENFDDTNGEHYWAWDAEAVVDLLDQAGFTVREGRTVDSTSYGEPYKYGIWLADRKEEQGEQHTIEEEPGITSDNEPVPEIIEETPQVEPEEEQETIEEPVPVVVEKEIVEKTKSSQPHVLAKKPAKKNLKKRGR